MCLPAVQKFGKIYLGLKYKMVTFMQLDIRMKTLFAQKKTNKDAPGVQRPSFFSFSLQMAAMDVCLGPRITYNGALIRGHRHQTPST